MLGVPLIPALTPAPTWWAHDSACAWTAAWLTVRGRPFLGEREVLSRPDWSGELHWHDRNSLKRSGHRPDLVAAVGSFGRKLRLELLDTIKEQSVASYAQSRPYQEYTSGGDAMTASVRSPMHPQHHGHV
jgi:hypothetical protein